MNEQLHHLLDGELPDDQTAVFLRHLAEDGADRNAFRQQMKLHGALYRNAGFGTMTTGEAGEMRARVERVVNGGGTKPASMIRRGVVIVTIIGATLVGGGLGFIAHDNLVPSVPTITVVTASPRINLLSAPPVAAVTSDSSESTVAAPPAVVRRSTARRSVRGKRLPQVVPGLPPSGR